MPDFPPLRQPELASFRVPFIPRLKPGVYWLFLLIKVKYHPGKNGGLVRLSYREVRERKWHGLQRWSLISETFQELESKRWIERAKTGGLFGKTNFYRLTFSFDEYGKPRG
jgi:hypothetical protein